MKKLTVSMVIIIALVAIAGQAFADDCCAQKPATTATAPPAGAPAAQTLPPAENLLQLTGNVISIAPNGAALVDTGTAKVYVMAQSAETADGTAPVSPFRVGDRVQVSGVLLALSVTSAQAQTQVPTGNAAPTQARFQVGNILCGACANSVAAALRGLEGVQSATVGADKAAQVTYDPQKVDVQALTQAIVNARHPHEGMHFTATLLK